MLSTRAKGGECVVQHLRNFGSRTSVEIFSTQVLSVSEDKQNFYFSEYVFHMLSISATFFVIFLRKRL